MARGKDENKKFNNAYNELYKIGISLKNMNDINELNRQYEDIFRKIKEKLSNNEERIQEFIQNLIDYYNITNNNLIDDLTILFKSKKYEFDIDSILFLFEYFERDNDNWNEKLPPRNYYLKGYYKEIDFQKFFEF